MEPCARRLPFHVAPIPRRGALYECITEEKPTALLAYLEICCIKQARPWRACMPWPACLFVLAS